MALTPAYAVDGGRVPAFMLRMTLWASTSGAEGIVRANDMRVQALSTPGGSVAILSGGALLTTKYTGQMGSQTYAVLNDATVNFSIPAAGATARTDYIIVRINEWRLDGTAEPANPLDALYCSYQRVSSISALTYPYLVLAKIVIPANTAAITNAMITDMREMALPRTQRVVRARALGPANREILQSTTREYFPNTGGQQSVPVPSWATRVVIRADWLSVGFPPAMCAGTMWVGFGDWTGSKFEIESETFSFNSPTGTIDGLRDNFTVVADLYVPPKYRDREVTFQMWASNKPGMSGKPWVDQFSGCVLDLMFQEMPDRSTS